MVPVVLVELEEFVPPPTTVVPWELSVAEQAPSFSMQPLSQAMQLVPDVQSAQLVMQDKQTPLLGQYFDLQLVQPPELQVMQLSTLQYPHLLLMRKEPTGQVQVRVLLSQYWVSRQTMREHLVLLTSERQQALLHVWHLRSLLLSQRKQLATLQEQGMTQEDTPLIVVRLQVAEHEVHVTASLHLRQFEMAELQRLQVPEGVRQQRSQHLEQMMVLLTVEREQVAQLVMVSEQAWQQLRVVLRQKPGEQTKLQLVAEEERVQIPEHVWQVVEELQVRQLRIPQLKLQVAPPSVLMYPVAQKEQRVFVRQTAQLVIWQLTVQEVELAREYPALHAPQVLLVRHSLQLVIKLKQFCVQVFLSLERVDMVLHLAQVVEVRQVAQLSMQQMALTQVPLVRVQPGRHWMQVEGVVQVAQLVSLHTGLQRVQPLLTVQPVAQEVQVVERSQLLQYGTKHCNLQYPVFASNTQPLRQEVQVVFVEQL